MKRLTVLIVLACSAVLARPALATDPYPEIRAIVPVSANAGQLIPNFLITGLHFDNLVSVDFRKMTGIDKLIQVKKIVSKTSTSVVVSAYIPPQLTGNRYVVVKTSVGPSALAFNSANTFQIKPYANKKADLRITQMTWGTSFNTNGNFIRVNVQNAGGTPAKGFNIDLFLNGVKKQTVNWTWTLPAGATVSFETNGLTIPRTKGSYLVHAYADTLHKIPETNENNNQLDITFVQPADEWVIPVGGFATYQLVVGYTAPNFTLQDGNLVPYTFYDYRGKPALIVLGAMWSTYTQAETAALKKIYDDYKSKGLVIIQILYDDLNKDDAVNTNPNPTLLTTWATGNQLTFPVLGDIAGTDYYHSAFGHYQCEYQPMNYIVKRDGTVQTLITGFLEQSIRDSLTIATGQ